MALSTTGANAAANGLVAAGHYISLHTGDPGTTGANEVAGGSYARANITWPAASAGSVNYSTNAVINVPAGAAVTHVGYWSAASAGNFIEGTPLAVPRSFVVAGTLTLSQLVVTPT